MLKKGEHIECAPNELQSPLVKDEKAHAFFESLPKSYKQGYCDWVGSAKNEDTQQIRVAKALIVLQNGQKTLKTQSSSLASGRTGVKIALAFLLATRKSLSTESLSVLIRSTPHLNNSFQTNLFSGEAQRRTFSPYL